MTVDIDGVPFFLILDDQGYYVMAVGQRVNVNGSPVIVSFDPPIAPTVNAGDLYQAIKGKL